MRLGVGLGVGLGAAQYLSGAKLWLIKGVGETLVSASLPLDVTSWTVALAKTPVNNGDGTVTLSDTNSSGYHQTYAAETGAIAGPFSVDLTLGPGTLHWCAVQLGSGFFVYIDLNNAVTGTATGDTTATLLSGSAGQLQRWRVSTKTATPSNLVVYTSTGNGVVNYAGAGTGTIIMGSGVTNGPVINQSTISAWSDQSGNGNNVAQSTAASRWFSTALGNGVAGDQTQQMTLPAGIYGLFAGTAKPITVVARCNRNGASTADSKTIAISGAGSDLIAPLVHKGTTDTWYSTWSDGSTTKQSAYGAISTSRKTVASSFDGANENLYIDGVLDGASPQNRAVGANAATAGIMQARQMIFQEIAVFNRALSASEIQSIGAGMAARWP